MGIFDPRSMGGRHRVGVLLHICARLYCTRLPTTTRFYGPGIRVAVYVGIHFIRLSTNLASYFSPGKSPRILTGSHAASIERSRDASPVASISGTDIWNARDSVSAVIDNDHWLRIFREQLDMICKLIRISIIHNENSYVRTNLYFLLLLKRTTHRADLQ